MIYASYSIYYTTEFLRISFSNYFDNNIFKKLYQLILIYFCCPQQYFYKTFPACVAQSGRVVSLLQDSASTCTVRNLFNRSYTAFVTIYWDVTHLSLLFLLRQYDILYPVLFLRVININA